MALGVTLLITFALGFVQLHPLISVEEEYSFKLWMLQHNRAYEAEEYLHRLHVFTENKRTIDAHNAGNHSFTMGLNHFSDMTFEEFRKFYLLTEPQNCSATEGSHVSTAGPYPEFVDWRMKGNFVTPVKNQVCDKISHGNDSESWFPQLTNLEQQRQLNIEGHCGSCWTFSTTGCLESVTAIATGKLIPLSEQQLIDCAQDFNNHGCMGGLPSQAFEYIKYNKGLMTEDDYPYKGHDDTCLFEPRLAAAFVREVINITSYDEKAMVDAVARLNPVSFGFDVASDFMHYKDGVYTSTQCENTPDMVNHAVLAVGYGMGNSKTPYWIVKNSWGATWGMDGYFLMERGVNMCGLAACASYPLPLV